MNALFQRIRHWVLSGTENISLEIKFIFSLKKEREYNMSERERKAPESKYTSELTSCGKNAAWEIKMIFET